MNLSHRRYSACIYHLSPLLGPGNACCYIIEQQDRFPHGKNFRPVNVCKTSKYWAAVACRAVQPLIDSELTEYNGLVPPCRAVHFGGKVCQWALGMVHRFTSSLYDARQSKKLLCMLTSFELKNMYGTVLGQQNHIISVANAYHYHDPCFLEFMRLAV